MRRILIENTRRRRAIRHGNEMKKLRADATGFDNASPEAAAELLLVHEALDALAVHDSRKAELVKLHHFVGLTMEEAARVMGYHRSHRPARLDLRVPGCPTRLSACGRADGVKSRIEKTPLQPGLFKLLLVRPFVFSAFFRAKKTRLAVRERKERKESLWFNPGW